MSCGPGCGRSSRVDGCLNVSQSSLPPVRYITRMTVWIMMSYMVGEELPCGVCVSHLQRN